MNNTLQKAQHTASYRVVAIVVNYRSAQLVCDLLRSFSVYPNQWVEHIFVVDNASGDDSARVIRDFTEDLGLGQRVTVLESDRNGGFGSGNNFAAFAPLCDELKPDIFWLLNPDTLVDELDSQLLLNWFEHTGTVGIVGTGLTDGDGKYEVAAHREPSPISEFIRNAGALRILQKYSVSDVALDRPGPVDWVSGASLLIRADLFRQLGGFDENFFLYFEEVDLCRRVRQAGWQVVYEPRVRVLHLEGQTTGVKSNKGRPKYWYESRNYFYTKHFGWTGVVAADLAWFIGRCVGFMRGRADDGCRLRQMWLAHHTVSRQQKEAAHKHTK